MYAIQSSLSGVCIIGILWGWDWFKGKRYSTGRWALVMLYTFYLGGVLAITGIPAIGEFRWFPDYNITFYHNYGFQYLLNILLFLPCGFLLPYFLGKCHSFWRTIGLSFLLSGVIEFLQLFNYRTTDIDDLIANTLGAMIGYLLFSLLNVLFHRFSFWQNGTNRLLQSGKGSLFMAFMVAWGNYLILTPLLNPYSGILQFFV